jgi:hypothetical protein
MSGLIVEMGDQAEAATVFFVGLSKEPGIRAAHVIPAFLKTRTAALCPPTMASARHTTHRNRCRGGLFPKAEENICVRKPRSSALRVAAFEFAQATLGLRIGSPV